LGTDLDAVLAQRRALGHDRFDEVWEGAYRMVPGPALRHALVDAEVLAALRPRARAAGLTSLTAFNLGEPADYRVPDQGYARGTPAGLYLPTAEVVVEVLSPGDDTYRTFPFFARHGVGKIVVVDPDGRRVEIHTLDAGEQRYRRTDASPVLGVTARDLFTAIDWPSAPDQRS